MNPFIVLDITVKVTAGVLGVAVILWSIWFLIRLNREYKKRMIEVTERAIVAYSTIAPDAQTREVLFNAIKHYLGTPMTNEINNQMAETCRRIVREEVLK